MVAVVVPLLVLVGANTIAVPWLGFGKPTTVPWKPMTVPMPVPYPQP